MRKKGKGKTKGKTSGSSKFWPGLLLGGAIAAAAVHYGPSLMTESDSGNSAARISSASSGEAPDVPKKGKATPAPQQSDGLPPKPRNLPSPTPSAPAGSGSVAFFRDPPLAASLLTRHGMGESHPGSLLWKNTDALGWNAFGVLAVSPAGVSLSGRPGNTVTCLLESRHPDRVEALRLTANIFNPAETAPTLSRFKSLAQAVLAETRCPATREFLEAIESRTGLRTEAAGGRFTLSQSPLSAGTRWELSVESR